MTWLFVLSISIWLRGQLKSWNMLAFAVSFELLAQKFGKRRTDHLSNGKSLWSWPSTDWHVGLVEESSLNICDISLSLTVLYLQDWRSMSCWMRFCFLSCLSVLQSNFPVEFFLMHDCSDFPHFTKQMLKLGFCLLGASFCDDISPEQALTCDDSFFSDWSGIYCPSVK